MSMDDNKFLYDKEFFNEIIDIASVKMNDILELEKKIDSSIKTCFESQIGKVQRSAQNDRFFDPISHYTTFCMWNFIHSRPLEILYPLMKYVVESFERKNGSPIHKGSPYYNIGLCEFMNGNLDTAMCYFEKASTEDRLLGRLGTEKDFLEAGLFGKHIFEPFKKDCCEYFKVEFKRIFNRELKPEDVTQLFKFLNVQNCLQLLFVLRRYFVVTCLEKNISTSVIRMRLLADMTHLLECNLAQNINSSRTLEKQLQVIKPDEIKKVCIEHINDKVKYKRDTIPDLNNTIGDIFLEFERGSQKERGGITLYLSYIIRNHTNHRLDETFILYDNIELFKKVMALIFVSHIIAQYHQQNIIW